MEALSVRRKVRSAARRQAGRSKTDWGESIWRGKANFGAGSWRETPSATSHLEGKPAVGSSHPEGPCENCWYSGGSDPPDGCSKWLFYPPARCSQRVLPSKCLPPGGLFPSSAMLLVSLGSSSLSSGRVPSLASDARNLHTYRLKRPRKSHSFTSGWPCFRSRRNSPGTACPAPGSSSPGEVGPLRGACGVLQEIPFLLVGGSLSLKSPGLRNSSLNRWDMPTPPRVES